MRTLIGTRRIHRLMTVPAQPIEVRVGFGRPGDGFDRAANANANEGTGQNVRVGLTGSGTFDTGFEPGTSKAATTPSGQPVTKMQIMAGLLMIAGVGVGAGAVMGWLLPATLGRVTLGMLAGGVSVLALPVVGTVIDGTVTTGNGSDS